MTLTIAIIINAVLMAGIVGALAYFIHLPQRIERHLIRERVIAIPRDEDELSRAA
jgi:hypothetical protein